MDNLKLEHKFEEQLDRIEKLLVTTKTILNIEEVCLYTGWSSSYIYKLTSENRIPHSKPRGKTIFFSKQALDNWLLCNPIQTTENTNKEASNYILNNKR